MFATLPRTNQTFALPPNDLFEAIEGLKQDLNAVILAHYENLDFRGNASRSFATDSNNVGNERVSQCNGRFSLSIICSSTCTSHL
jgi:hypothetical protein